MNLEKAIKKVKEGRAMECTGLNHLCFLRLFDRSPCFSFDSPNQNDEGVLYPLTPEMIIRTDWFSVRKKKKK